MYKKIIKRGEKEYYYTNVRKNGEVRNIFLNYRIYVKVQNNSKNQFDLYIKDNAFDGDNILTLFCSSSPLSPESMGQFNLSAKAKYGESLKFNSITSGSLSENSENGMILVSLLMDENTSDISSFDNLLCNNILSNLLPISENKNSGATNSKTLKNLLDSKTSNGLPLLINAEKTEFASITNNMSYLFNNFLYLLANDKLTSSPKVLACSSINLDLDTILLILDNSSNSSFNLLSIANCQFILDADFNSINSSGNSNFNSILTSKEESKNEYINISNFELVKIKDVYSDYDNKGLYFLDENLNEIKINKISKEGNMYNIETEQGNLLVSPEHRVYVKIKNQSRFLFLNSDQSKLTFVSNLPNSIKTPTANKLLMVSSVGELIIPNNFNNITNTANVIRLQLSIFKSKSNFSFIYSPLDDLNVMNPETIENIPAITTLNNIPTPITKFNNDAIITNTRIPINVALFSFNISDVNKNNDVFKYFDEVNNV